MSMAKDLSFGLPFFYRVVLPGTLLAAAAAPLARRLLEVLSIQGTETQTWLAAGLAVLIGFILSVLDDPIYQLYEGRHGWPGWLASALTRRWQRHVASLQSRAAAAKRNDTAAYDELWSEIRQFPSADDETYTATRPTKMGNILASYEDYPKRRYGMDSVFYWYRLWLHVDKDVREEVDRTWAGTDALMYLAAGSGALGVIYLLIAVVSVIAGGFGRPGMVASETETIAYALWGGGLVLLSYLPYRFSISGHLQNGELYKSLFDLYHVKLRPELAGGAAEERAQWRATWAALQYGIDPPPPRPRSDLGLYIGAGAVGTAAALCWAWSQLRARGPRRHHRN
jgi:hypothetical protein